MPLDTQRRRAARGIDAVERRRPISAGRDDPLQTGFKYVEELFTGRTVQAAHHDERPAGTASVARNALLGGETADSVSP